jgi:hypothetical protein
VSLYSRKLEIRSGESRLNVGRAPSWEGVFLTAVVFSSALRHGEIQQAGLLGDNDGWRRRKVRRCGQKYGRQSDLFVVLVDEVSMVNNIAEGSQ